MSIALITPNRSIGGIHSALETELGESLIQVWPHLHNQESVKLAVSWDHPTGIWQQFPNLEAVLSLGAGADHLIADPTIPASIQLGRVVTPSLKQQMAEFVLMHLLWIQRKMEHFRRREPDQQWDPTAPWNKAKLPVGILGLGELGSAVAYLLNQHNVDIHGWSRSRKQIPNVVSHTGPQGLDDMGQSCRVFVCLLPLTNETQGILNSDLFNQMPDSSYLIQVGRGEHLVEQDLLDALESNKLASAYLDVFAQEPLPPDHAFWNHPNIHITPHIASLTPPDEAAQQIANDYRKILNKQPLTHPVDRELGY
ncbi:MAG: 2-hydroxyacid dehydrogenase [Bacteroidota bacterium]